MKKALRILCIIAVFLLIFLAISEKVELEKNHDVIKYSSCDENGNFIIQNKSHEDIKVIIKYEFTTENDNIKESKIVNISSKGHIKLNMYDISNINKEDIISLNVYIDEFKFIMQIQPYISFCFIIIIICIAVLYVFIKVLTKIRKEN